MELCAYRPASAVEAAKYAGCPAYAVSGHQLCAAHLSQRRGDTIVRPRRSMKESDADKLPFTTEDWGRIEGLRPAKRRKAREAGAS